MSPSHIFIGLQCSSGWLYCELFWDDQRDLCYLRVLRAGRGAYIVSYFGMTRGTFAISGFWAGGRGAYIVSYFGMTRGTFAISGFSAGGRGAYIVSYFGMTRGTFAISGFWAERVEGLILWAILGWPEGPLLSQGSELGAEGLILWAILGWPEGPLLSQGSQLGVGGGGWGSASASAAPYHCLFTVIL